MSAHLSVWKTGLNLTCGLWLLRCWPRLSRHVWLFSTCMAGLQGGKKLRTFIRCYVWPGGVYFTMRTVGIEEWDAVYLLSEMCSPTKEHLLSYNQFNGNAIYFPMLSISSFGVKNHQKLLHHNQCLAKSASDWRRSQVRERTCREGSVLQQSIPQWRLNSLRL